ncbi:hypothetical protein Tco_0829710 [Tanacetum coccineum]
MVSSLKNNEIDFRISFDESDDEYYTVVFDKNSFCYKIISTNDLKTYSKNDNEKVNMPLFPSPEPTISCFDDLDFFKDFENEFPAIVYNDALTSKSDFSIEPTLCPQHIDEFDFKDETSLSKYDEEEQNVLYFNDLFPFNIIYPGNPKSDKGNDDNEIDTIQSSVGNENTQRSNKLLEESHDKINKVFIIKSFVTELNINIMAWNYFVNGMLVNLIKSLYMPFGIPFDPKQYYKDGDCARMLQRPRHLWLRYQVMGYTEEIVHDFEQRLETIFGRQVNRVHILDFKGFTPDMRQDLAKRMRMVYTGDDGQEAFMSHAWRRLFRIRAPLIQECILKFFSTCRIEDEMGLDVAGTLCFQLGGARRSMTWRQFILALGLYTAEEMAEDRFGTYWLGSERVIPDKGDLSDYWVEISSGMDFLRGAPSYIYIKDPVQRLCHRYAEGRKSGARLSGGYFIGRLAHHFGLVASGPERQQVAVAGAPEAVKDAPAVDEGAQANPAPVQAPQPLPPPSAAGRKSRLAVSSASYVTEPSRLSKSGAELRRESVYKYGS